MTLSDGLLLDGAYIDFMGFVPAMTHLFNHEKLNRRFTCLLEPNDFCNAYYDYFLSKYRSDSAQLFIHNVGKLRVLTDYEIRANHFWSNLVSNDVHMYLQQMKVDGIFPYLPFIAKPDFNISVHQPMIDSIADIEFLHLSTEIRLFPHGVVVAHIKACLDTPLTIEQLIEIQSAFNKQQIFNLNQSGATRLELETGKRYSLQQLFAAISKCVWKTLYMGDTVTIDKSTPLLRHRIVNPLADFALTDFEVAAMLSLTKKPKHKEIEDGKKHRVKKTLDPKNDIIAFDRGATLLYAPKNDLEGTKCFRTNYSNVIEFALLQDFFLFSINSRLDREIKRFFLEKRLDLGELYSSAIRAIYPSFSRYSENLWGGHKLLLKLVRRRTKFKLKEVKFLMMFDDVVPAQELIAQMKEPQAILLTMMNNTYQQKFEGGLLTFSAIQSVHSLGDSIRSQIEAGVLGLQQQQLKSEPNQADVLNLRAGIQKQMYNYKTVYLLQYKHLVEKLLANKEQIKKNIDQRRQAGEKVPTENQVQELLKSATDKLADAKKLELDLQKTDSAKPKSFFEKAKPYLGAIAGAAVSVLKALGYLPA